MSGFKVLFVFILVVVVCSHGVGKAKKHDHDHEHNHEHEHVHGHDHHNHNHAEKKDLNRQMFTNTKFDSIKEKVNNVNYSNKKHHNHDHSHSHHCHGHSHEGKLNTLLIENLNLFLENKDSITQGYLGSLFVSLVPLPIFLIFFILRLNNSIILDLMTAFSAGALLGDVIFHNFQEIFSSQSVIKTRDPYLDELVSKEMFICYGIMFIFVYESIISGSSHNHSHGDKTHNHNEKQIGLAFINDFIHNLTDGVAIASSFKINTKLGISSVSAILLHEIPHELADFSFLLKNKVGLLKCLLNQFLASVGAFAGVYLSNFLI